ncbi:type VI secretion system baseplate subunit TssG [Edaphobacter modestus]|uniref:Type VI secretion system protein ImpH n=1 Tax=Edaphobacter modestus TaxID=388466 RepID=A0A4Q7Y0G1_9BACT|nr:type VI secretion system baseplate subunit TssG [Edaphobacter modestus]RZU29764.1 type VI secretion system protein ImpH [Edaphobacter modestus]
MTSFGWRESPSIRQWLFTEPYRFEFIQAVRLLEQFTPSTPLALGPDPSKEAVQLRSHVGFDFAPSELRTFLPPQDSRHPPELVVNLYSLAGGASPLPDWVAELLQAQARNRDHALRDFFDIFHHRLLSLLYRVHLHHRSWLEPIQPQNAQTGADVPTTRRSRNKMSQYLLAFSGLGLQELQNRLSIPDEELLPYAGLFWQRPRSLVGLERILEHALEIPVASRSLLGSWNRIEPEDRTRLGVRCSSKRRSLPLRSRNNALGRTLVLGTRTWNPQGRFDLILGPLSFAEFQKLLPGGPTNRRLIALVHFYAGDVLEVHTHLRLSAADVPVSRLGRSRLGWTSWLKTRHLTQAPTVTLRHP